MCHDTKDLSYILQSETVRNLSCFISYDSDNKITGVAFSEKDDIKHTRVVAIYVQDTCSYYALLDFIKHKFYDHSISVVTSDPNFQTLALIQQTYASSNPAGGDLDNTFSVVEIPFNINKLYQPSGMVNLLNYSRIMQYLASTRSDVDFKLHIRDFKTEESEGKKLVFNLKNGKCSIDYKEEISEDKTVLNLTKKEVSELLLRKNDSSNLIMEAFGIPRLNLQTRLLPC